jgi:hypothetical protein
MEKDLIEEAKPLVRSELAVTNTHCQELVMRRYRPGPSERIRPTGRSARIGLGLPIAEMLARALNFDV